MRRIKQAMVALSMYAIEKNLLAGGKVVHAPTKKMGGTLLPRFLLIHYTAGASFDADVRTLSTDPVQASVHIVIGRGGELTQIVPLNRVAWHAGESRWGNLNGMNQHTIGIELSNAGLVKKDVAGEFRTWWGAKIPQAEVIEAHHERGGPLVGWHTYTSEPIETLLEVARVLHARFNFLDILGHDDVSWPRKTDPGPAFPMGSLKSRVIGRSGYVERRYDVHNHVFPFTDASRWRSRRFSITGYAADDGSVSDKSIRRWAGTMQLWISGRY